MQIELQSKQSNEFICTLCSASNQVKGHDFIVLSDLCLTKKTGIEELEKVISPSYMDITNNLENYILNLEKDYEKRTIILSKNPG